MQKHVAGSGARVGQWVNCTAKNCRLGGTHISERELYAAGAWLNETGDKKRLSQITKEDVEKFQASTKGQEEEWAKKAEVAARRAKGIKGNYQIFAGEKNLVEVSEPKKFVPNTGKAKTPVAPVAPPLPPGTRVIEIPGVARFMNRGDTAALAQAIQLYKIPRETVVSIASLRVRMVNNAPHTAIYTNTNTGESHQGLEIPEVKEFLKTGDESKLDEAAKTYDLGIDYVEALKESQRRHAKKEAKEAKKASATGLRAAAQKMKAASARLTNVTDDMADLTSEKKDTVKPSSSGKTVYEALSEAKTVSERAARTHPRPSKAAGSTPSPKTPKPAPAEPSVPSETPADKIAESVGKFMDRFRK